MATVLIKNVTKAFGDNVVLRDFDAEFSDGEFITLLGPSGCGKTTMLRMIAGFERPTGGEIFIDGELVSGGKVFIPPEKRGVGMVFQSYAVWPHMNVFDNVAYPLSIRHTPKAEIKSAVNRVLGIVHLSQYAERFPNQLSADSSSAWRSRELWWPNRSSCSWTSRCLTSTQSSASPCALKSRRFKKNSASRWCM